MSVTKMSIMAIVVAVASQSFGQLPRSAMPEMKGMPQETSYKAWSVMPYADISGVSDSNFLRSENNEESETYFDALAGLTLSYNGINLNAIIAGFASARWHQDYTDADFENVGQGIRLRYGTRDTIQWEANQAYRRVTETDTFGSEVAVGNVSPDSVLDSASTSERDILQATLKAGYNPTDKSEIDASYRFDSVDYTDDSILKVTSQSALLEIASQVTDKSSGILAIEGGIQDSEAVTDDADFYSASLGLKTKGTDKLRLKAKAGFQQYNRPNGETEDSAVYDASASLAATDKLSLNVGARNGTQLSSLFAGNGTEYDILFAGASLKASESIRLSANASYRTDEYLDQVNGQDREDTGTAFSVRADYTAPSEYLKLYLKLTQQTVESGTSEYDQTLVSLGARLQY